MTDSQSENQTNDIHEEMPEISWHGQVIDQNVVIPPNVNAWTKGHVTLAPDIEVTVSPGSTWEVI